LTGRPALDGRDREEVLRKIAHDEPIPLWRIDSSIPRDLQTIVMKAMSREPSRRYPSAQDLADDLGRFLADQPIKARRPSAPERLARWGRRHRTLVACAAVLLVVAAVGSTIGATLLWTEMRRTEKNLIAA
jgi:hypothetical protein